MKGRWWAILLIVCGAGLSARAADDVDRLIDAMSPDERLAQLLFAGARSPGSFGGVVLYASDIRSAPQLRELTAALAARSSPPPFIAVDQEGGEVTRVAGDVPQLPGNMALGATGSPDLARRAGRELSAALRRLGITMNLAPVLDRCSRPDSSIGIRSFGTDPQLAGTLGAAFIEGSRQAGLATVAKHFPGIGASEVDSHDALPRLEIDERDLAPFRAAVAAGVDAIMLGHVSVPRRELISLLRKDLHFDGIVMTDALEMGAVDRSAGIGPIAVQAIADGADMVMVLSHPEEALAALRSARLSDAQIRASLRRVLMARRRLAGRSAAVPAADTSIADEIAAASATLVLNDALIPLRHTDLYIGPSGPIADAVAAPRTLHPPVRFDHGDLGRWSAAAARQAAGATLIVAAAQNRDQMAVIRAAHEAVPTARVVLISLGSPQLIRDLPAAGAYLCVYGYLPPSQRAAARVLRGAPAPGRVPVEVLSSRILSVGGS